ncbi:MAG: hypothetical protein IJH77_04310 [Mogibacterium sp.]|nr:hypothetical protein [Mogibacterium sp.]
MKHLFLEGPIQIGKSTLLRQFLLTYRNRLGGFSSQRLLDAEGNVQGYRITDVQDFCLEQPYDPSLPGIFLTRTAEGTRRDPSVFTDYAPVLLQNSLTSDLILLDEIGGMELLVPEFHRAVTTLLAGDTPCIGVLKSPDNAERTGRHHPDRSALLDANRNLRRELTETFDAQILTFASGRCLYEASEEEQTRQACSVIQSYLAVVFASL